MMALIGSEVCMNEALKEETLDKRQGCLGGSKSWVRAISLDRFQVCAAEGTANYRSYRPLAFDPENPKV